MTDLLDDATNFYEHIKRYTASIATTVVYGYRAPTPGSFWGRVCSMEIQRTRID